VRLPDHRLVFVCGLHRSGTTPLTRCLAEHPEVSGFRGTGVPEDEGQHLQDVYAAASVFGGPGVFAFDPRAHRTEADLRTPQTTAWRLFSQWRRHWDMARPVLVEKSPPNLMMMRYLQRLFPRARFVVVMRHPVVTALATRKWRRRLGLEALVEHWLAAHEIAAQDATHIERLHVVRYEHLVSRPRSELRRLADFIGLDAAPPAATLRGDRSRRYERRWRAQRLRPASWRDSHAALRGRFERRCAAFGYRMRELDKAEGRWALLANPYAWDLT
jgi:hypothetical protein